MTETRPPAPHGCKPAERQARTVRKLSTVSLRKLARTHTAAAVQALAEIAASGDSEASRIAAAMALLDRGYGKMGTGIATDISENAPKLYQRIELIDGTAEQSDKGHQRPDHTN